MSEKVSYIALVTGVGAVGIAVTTAILTSLGSGARIAELEAKLKQLEETTSSSSVVVEDTRARVDELDLGLTALINLSGVPLEDLHGAMANQKAQIAAQLNASSDQPESHPSLSLQPHRDEPLTTPELPPIFEPETSINLANQTAGADTFEQFIEEVGASEPAPTLTPVLSLPVEPVTVGRVDSILSHRISTNWVKPAGSVDGLKAVVRMKLARDGKLISVEVTQSSGNQPFDDSALSAIQDVGPIDEIARLSDQDYAKFYKVRDLLFSPGTGG